MAREYDLLKHHGAINDRKFMQRSLFSKCAYPKFNVDVVEVFNNREPNYLILHIVVTNLTDEFFNFDRTEYQYPYKWQKVYPSIRLV